MREIKTPWGLLSPEVKLFPIYYLIFIYGFVYILPFGEYLVGSVVISAAADTVEVNNINA